MGPARTSKTPRQSEPSSSSIAGPSKRKPKRHHPQKEPTGLPGVQKIKSALRQTRRLLAKDNLAADVRVETERRLKTLEADLAKAQASRKERDIAVRYHKVKFFERQKVVRKLNQTKKRLASADASSKPELEAALFELRVDLNYILHYPKTKKYISLFPPDIREDSTSSDTLTPKVNPNSEELRSWIRARMAAGEIPLEAELHLGQDKNASGGVWTGSSSKRTVLSGSKEAPSSEEPEDAFFGDDADSDDDE
ncbi:putative rRNA-processing protein Efg1 [Lyophyllum shimeji]|uniref:rRNA-processing protein EFG1 n=1 Tax=Lyophyllum shimeji TaxID=47721 RepID=A0A9P3UNJ2_LYOSH|nr:putative rRNA-processing protein Efg1 [Lyophyllum shimeji]